MSLILLSLLKNLKGIEKANDVLRKRNLELRKHLEQISAIVQAEKELTEDKAKALEMIAISLK